MNSLLDMVLVRVTKAMHHELEKPYVEDGVKFALFRMAPSKALGMHRFIAEKNFSALKFTKT